MIKEIFFKTSLKSHIFKNDLPYVLRMEDRNSMANSIESRVPFLDHILVENAFKIKFVPIYEKMVKINIC